MFAENYCWAQDTYYLSFDQDLTRSDELRNAKIGYYQWVPFFLLLSALSFQIPTQMWRFLSTGSGIRLESLVEQAIDPKNIVLEARQQAIRVVAIHLENALRFQHRLYKRQMVPHKVLRFLNLPYKAFFMTFIYLIVKMLYVINVFAQFLLMNFFLQTGSSGWYGWATLSQLMNGTQWSTSGFFPRVTLCDFYIRVPGTVQRYSIQCVLSINLFTEKIFIFLWFWYHILAVVTVFSLLYWFIVCLPPWFPRWFVVRHLELADMPFDPVESSQQVKRFVHHYLRTDGVFVLRMINMHTGVIFSSEVVAALYKSHVGIEKLVKTNSQSHGHGKWPNTDKILKLVPSGSVVTVEKVHPPPIKGFDELLSLSVSTKGPGAFNVDPDTPGKVSFHLDNANLDEGAQSLYDETDKLKEIDDDQDDDDDVEGGKNSPYGVSSTRKRHVAINEKA